MSELQVRAAKRQWYERFFKDPLVGLLAIVLWSVFGILPLDMASSLGGWMGKLLPCFLRKKQKIALFNLARCFPEKSEEERKKITRDMWEHFGRMVAEIPHARKMINRIKIEGMEFFDQIKNVGKGGLLASGHVGNWELIGPLTLSLGILMHPVYRAANNPWIEKFVFSRRRTKGVCLIPKGTSGAKLMIELLRKGEHIGILCDQKLREGIDVPFFGYPAKTAPAVATLALKFNVPILPFRVVREQGAHYTAHFYKPLDIPNTNDKTADTYQLMLSVNQMLESWIRERPEQWLWIHHRWDKSEYPH